MTTAVSTRSLPYGSTHVHVLLIRERAKSPRERARSPHVRERSDLFKRGSEKSCVVEAEEPVCHQGRSALQRTYTLRERGRRAAQRTVHRGFSYGPLTEAPQSSLKLLTELN